MSSRVFINSVDKTADVQNGTVKIKEALNNRRDTFSAKTVDYQVSEGQELVFYEGSDLNSQASSGQKDLIVDEIFEDIDKFRVDDVIYIAPHTANEEKRTITSINTGTKTITVSQNLTNTHIKGVFVGKKSFGGIVLRSPDAEIGNSELIEDNLKATDYSNLFDRKVVVDTFEQQYPREIISRIVYQFCANDTETTVFNFETTVDQSQQTEDTTVRVGDTGGSEYMQAQKFTPTQAGMVAIKLKKDSTLGAVAGNLTAELRSDTAGDPDTILASTTLSNSDWFDVRDGVEFFLPLDYTVTPATDYWIVLSTAASGSNDEGFVIKSRTTGTGRKYSTDGGSSWSAGTTDIWFETHYVTMTVSGVARPIAADPSNQIQGNFSYKLGATGAGTATYTQAVASVDLTSKTHFRLWLYLNTGVDLSLTSFTVRLGSDASNYYEWTVPNLYDEIWSWESFAFSEATITGSPVISAIDWLQLEFVSTGSIAEGDIKVDHALSTTGGFTLVNTQKGSRVFEDVRVQYKSPTATLESLAKMINWFWYVDYDRDVHFFDSSTYSAFEELTDSSLNYGDLRITADITNLKNRQTVRGGSAPSETDYEQKTEADGQRESFTLDYSPKDLRVFEDRGATSTFTEVTVGVENLTDETTVGYVFNFTEKIVRRASASILASGDIIKFIYKPFKKIRVRVKDETSIASMIALTGGDGIYDGSVINDSSIRDYTEARQRAIAEIEAFKNPILSATFQSDKDGWRSGQIVKITDSTRGLSSAEFLVQRVVKTARDESRFSYQITAGSTLFGITEFFQLILARQSVTIDGEAQVDVILNIDETITLTDGYSYDKHDYTTGWVIFGETIDQSQTDTTNDSTFGKTGESEKIAQSFKPTQKELSSVTIYKSGETGTVDTQDTFTIALHEDNGGEPAATALKSFTFQKNLINDSAVGEINLPLPWKVEASGTTTYWWVLTSTTNSSSNYFSVKAGNGDLYANGQAKRYDGATWNAYANDFYFKVFYADETITVGKDMFVGFAEVS
ncbi:MAG: hypothetical protein V3U02_04485 [Calditrichia bacterium]